MEQLETLLQGASSVRLPCRYPAQDLRTSQSLSLMSEMRVSAVPVGLHPHPDYPILAPLLLTYSLSSRFLQAVLSPSGWKQRGSGDDHRSAGVGE